MDDDSKQAWMKVGLHFAAAGDKLREHAKGAASGAKASAGDASSGPDQAAVTDATIARPRTAATRPARRDRPTRGVTSSPRRSPA